MVDITNGKDIFKVTKGAYEDIYKPQGYILLDNDKVQKVEIVNDEPQLSEEELIIQELMEKPLSSWKQKEVIEFCDFFEIDISEAKTPKIAKEIVKQYLDNKFEEKSEELEG